jgi:hypothetical protein
MQLGIIKEILQGLQTNLGKITPGTTFNNVFEVGGRAYGHGQIDVRMIAFNGHLQFEFHAYATVFAGERS